MKTGIWQVTRRFPAQPLRMSSSLNLVQTRDAPSLHCFLYSFRLSAYHSSSSDFPPWALSSSYCVPSFFARLYSLLTVSTCSKTLCTIYPIQTCHSPYTSVKNYLPGKIYMNKLKLNTLFICSVLLFPNLVILSGYGWQTSAICGVLKQHMFILQFPIRAKFPCSLCVKCIELFYYFNLSLNFHVYL